MTRIKLSAFSPSDYKWHLNQIREELSASAMNSESFDNLYDFIKVLHSLETEAMSKMAQIDSEITEQESLDEEGTSRTDLKISALKKSVYRWSGKIIVH